jgi:hypothetical protein
LTTKQSSAPPCLREALRRGTLVIVMIFYFSGTELRVHVLFKKSPTNSNPGYHTIKKRREKLF